MTPLGDRVYAWAVGRRFRGKGEPDLSKVRATFSTLHEWKERAAKIRAGVLEAAGLSPLPKKTPMRPLRHSRRRFDGYSVENVALETLPGFFSTGNLYLPDPAPPGKVPVLLKPHGHWKDARFAEYNQRLCSTLARMGVATFTYDMVGFGESTQLPHATPRSFALQTWNSIRALDFALSLPGADQSRVGCTGASGGGTQTMFLAALDDRVTCSAPVVMVSSFFFGGCACESGLPVHRGPGYATNNAEVAALATPRPQLVVSVGKDWTRLVPRREFPFIRDVYSLYGAADAVENVHLAGEGHDFGTSKRQAVYQFFARRFGLDVERVAGPSGAINEGGVVLQEREALLAFDDDHPRPDDALTTEGEVLDALRD
ncbi:MAG: hypothetical protein Kow0069_30670 [Promethearchaeota archaeon]